MDVLVFPGAVTLREWENRMLEERGSMVLDRALLLDQIRDGLLGQARGNGLLDGQSLSELARFSLLNMVLRDEPGADLRETLGFAGALNALEVFSKTFSAVAVDPRLLTPLITPESVGTVPSAIWDAYCSYRDQLMRLGLVDRLDENRAVLDLIGRSDLRLSEPLSGIEAGLDQGDRLVFKSVRWLDPFRSRLISALNARWKGRGLCIESVLPDELMERWQKDLLNPRLLHLFRGADPGHGYSAAWYGLLDAWAVLDPVIALQQREEAAGVEFFTSVGDYGEVEDLARRVAYAIDEEGIEPQRIGLVFRDLGARSELVVDVFQRFGIPLSFRRGLPMNAAPCIQVLLNMMRLPGRRFPRREVEQILNSPWLQLKPVTENGELDRAALTGALRESGIRYLDDHEQVNRRPVLAESGILQWIQDLARLHGDGTRRCIGAWAKATEDLLLGWMPVQERVAQHLEEQAGRVPVIQQLQFNSLAFSRLREICRELVDMPQLSTQLSLDEFLTFFAEWLSRETVPLYTDEAGVRVLTPYDACGLELDLVLIGGLNTSVFPASKGADGVWSEGLRETIAGMLHSLGVDPGLAWPTDAQKMQQERLLFFGAALSASGGLVLSCQSHDEDGQVEVPSIFFEVPWYLAGWPALPELDDSVLTAYERKRLESTPMLSLAWEQECRRDRPHQRRPFPGDSGPATRPEKMCLAMDEWRQARVRQTAATSGEWSASGLDDEWVRLIRLELDRDRFFMDTGREASVPSPYCGGFTDSVDRERLKEWLLTRVWSASALSSLLNCRYQFLCRYGMGLREMRANEELPDPRDRGQAWHRVMAAFFLVKRGAIPDWVNPGSRFGTRWEELGKELGRTNSLVREGDVWRLHRGSSGGRPVTVLTESPDQLEAQCRRVFDLVCEEMDANGAFLGDPQYWALERERGWAGLARLLETAVLERDGLMICPVDLEWEFGRETSGEDAVEIRDPAGSRSIKVAGVVDRADALINQNDELCGVEVWDYKGGGKSDAKSQHIIDKVEVQIPVYWMAVSKRWEEAGVKSAGYLIYEPSAKYDRRSILVAGDNGACDWAGKKDHPIMSAQSPLEVFQERVWKALKLVFDGDFSISPIDCTFCEFSHICRVMPQTFEAGGGGG